MSKSKPNCTSQSAKHLCFSLGNCVLERNGACCKAPLPSAAADSSESPQRFHFTIAFTNPALSHCTFPVVVPSACSSDNTCLSRGKFRSSAGMGKEIGSCHTLRRQFRQPDSKEAKGFGCSHSAESKELLFTAACENPTGTT